MSNKEPREWRHREFNSESVPLLVAETGFSPLVVKFCLSRGLKTAAEIKAFLDTRLEQLTDPFLIRDMDLAVDRLVVARNNQEYVRVFGDYDVDGTCGAALLSWIFREMGFKYDAFQPDRFKDGYGLGVKAVEEAGQAKVEILVSVDCGISSFDAAQKAKELGIDLIIVDHHQIDPIKGLPIAHAVLDPQRSDCPSGLKQLCGCGLAFYLAIALRKKGRELGWFGAGPGQIPEPQLKQHLDLVTIATAADLVPLTGDNRVLIKNGLAVLKTSKKVGVAALMERAGLQSRDLSPGHLGFVLGPRINASGRIQNAGLALELLTTQDPGRAQELALTLEKLNEERSQIQNQIWDQVKSDVEAGIAEGRFEHAVVVARAEWHEGVIGIVASRVTEFFRRPAIILSVREDLAKGSVRSYGGKDVLQALRNCSEHLLGFGGHKYAAGLSLSQDFGKIREFADAFNTAVGALSEEKELKPLWIEADCELGELTVDSLLELERLGPFGTGNPEPQFEIRAWVGDMKVIKERHLRLELMSEGGEESGIQAIWFHAVDREDVKGWLGADQEAHQDAYSWVGVPEINRFRGRMTPNFRIKDYRAIEQ